jgi:hypothetical protein
LRNFGIVNDDSNSRREGGTLELGIPAHLLLQFVFGGRDHREMRVEELGSEGIIAGLKSGERLLAKCFGTRGWGGGVFGGTGLTGWR